MAKISVRKQILCELLRLYFKRKNNNIKRKNLGYGKFVSKATWKESSMLFDHEFFFKHIATQHLDFSQWYLTVTVCSYHVPYALQSESTLYSCLNVKELLARNRKDIWSLSDCNETRIHNQLVRKRTLNL